MKEFSRELQEYVDKLLHSYGQDDYEEVFEIVAGELNVNDQYLVKSEVGRVKEPCERLIDLRGEVDGECKKYAFEGRIHYMDPVAISVFENGITAYGSYCIGLWNDVHNTENNFRVIEEKRKLAIKQMLEQEQLRRNLKLQDLFTEEQKFTADDYPAHMLLFGAYLNRNEERMNFSIQAVLVKGKKKEIEATTRDISVNGIRVRITPEHDVLVGDKLLVKLTGLDKEYLKAAPTGVQYEVKKLEYKDGAVWLGMQRTYKEQEDLFTPYISGFIKGNKGVYKIDLENVIDAALKKGYEQAFFARSNTFPIFVSQNDSQDYKLDFILSSGYADSSVSYWTDETGVIQLEQLFTSQHIKYLIAAKKDNVTLFSFQHENQGKLWTFAAFDYELESEPKLKNAFWGYGSKKPSWKAHKVTLSKLNVSDALVDFELPIQVTESSKAEQNLDVFNFIEKLEYCIQVNDITDKASTMIYSNRKYDNGIVSKLKRFQLEKQIECNVKRINIGLEELRKEPRYNYNTKAIIKTKKFKVAGNTSDFSAQGLKIQSDRALPLVAGNTLYLSFPLLQKITKKHELKDLPYRIIRLEKDQKTFYLKAVQKDEESIHAGVDFFTSLIQQNANKLKLAQAADVDIAISQLLKNMYQQCISSIPYFFHISQGKARLNRFISRDIKRSVFQLFESKYQPSLLNLSSLVANVYFADYLNGLTKPNSEQEKSSFIDVYIREELNSSDHLTILTNRELKTLSARKMFVSGAIRKGKFHCWRFTSRSVNNVTFSNLSAELEYISLYSKYKFEELHTILNKMCGLGELVDIKEQVISYLGVYDEETYDASIEQPIQSNDDEETDEFGSIPL